MSSSPYQPKWERLHDALERVTSAGIAEIEAKQIICNAIADGAIKIRCTLRNHTSSFMTARGNVIDGADISIPAHLKPQDMDFENSRPLKPWLLPRDKIRYLAGYWTIDWLELLRADTNEQLISTAKNHLSEPASSDETLPRRQPARERAQRVIRELYPEGPPDQAAAPNAILCRRVALRLKELKLPPVSDETIRRAAGRRK